MPSLFAALENALSDICDAHFGETFEHRPMVAAPGGGRRSADASRAVRSFVGIFTDDSFSSKALGSEERTASRITFRKIELAVDRRAFGAGPPPRRADRVVRLDTGQVLEVADVHEDSEQRLVLRLAHVATETS